MSQCVVVNTRASPMLSGFGCGACVSYSGGKIVAGNIVATVGESGALNMRYQHVNTAGTLMVCPA